jgi:hypothetical protein
LTEPQLKVTCSYAIVPGLPPPALSVGAVNVGQVPVTLTSVEAEGKGAEGRIAFFDFMMQSGGRLPVKLGPGESWDGFLNVADVRDAVAKMMDTSEPPWRVRLNVGDAARNRHRAEWMTFT